MNVEKRNLSKEARVEIADQLFQFALTSSEATKSALREKRDELADPPVAERSDTPSSWEQLGQHLS